MANQWLRLWHDMPNDPKWRTIARASKQRISDVLAVYLHVLVNASANASERGRTHNLCVEDVASALDLEDEQVQAILDAMQGRVLEGDHVSGWSNRQPAREDGSADRAKAWRERQKQVREQERTQANAEKRPDTDTDKESITSPNGEESGNDVPGPSVPSCPHREIIELYHEILPMGTQVRVWNDSRAKALQARWREDPKRQSLDWWRRFFEYVAKSEFLTGRTQSTPDRDPFVVSLDWLVAPRNFAKVIEGRYHREAA